MAIRIHHTQVKQAAKLGITLTKGDMDVTASKDNKSASAPSAGLAIAALIKMFQFTTADVVKALKTAKPAKTKKARKAKKPTFKCENEECGCTRREKTEDGFVCAECGEDATMDGDEDGASVVKRVYKTRYKPHKAKCGDEISKLISAHVMSKDPETKKMVMDQPKLARFAKANGCWDPNYLKLNGGMQRMNIANRIRGKVRRDKHEIVWPN